MDAQPNAHPYVGLPPDRSWRRAVAGTPPFGLDPGQPGAFRLSRGERIATAGSCFAQNLARALDENGCHFYVAEPEPTEAGVERAGPPAFSARYGNIYTTRQLLQLAERAYGTFAPDLPDWRRADGRHVDPFRPRVAPPGYGDRDAMEAARAAHLGHVRALFEGLDTFVFTLGLTEGWREAESGAALPLPPGVAGGIWDPAAYRFVNQDVAEMIADMTRFVDRLREVNPRARIILTVSPVPLAMTYTRNHVLVANTYSKAALRVVAEMTAAARPDVFYFPSYEIVTAPTNVARYFAEDLRSVTPAGIAHVMRAFMRHVDDLAPAARSHLDVRRESREAAGIICDEDLLDA